ncbi:MAG: T9SS type A sorting domain-containing protein [Candidatus Cloacimonadota bacterium]
MFKRLVIVCLLYCLAAGLTADPLDKVYFSPGSDTDPYINILYNAGAYLDIYYLDQFGMLQTQNTTQFMGNEEWSYGTISPLPSHPWVGLQGIYSIPMSRNRFGMANPIFFPQAQGMPHHSKFCPVESDLSGDHNFTLAHLDILESKIAFSEDKLHYAIRVNSNSFPTSSGLTFYSYMGVLGDPAADPNSNPIVFGLMNTVNVSGVIGPGLYKIIGTGINDLEQIGEIEITNYEADGVMVLSCNLADLLADPDFSSWYDPQYPLISTMALTSKITLTGGTQTADDTAGMSVLLRPIELDYSNLHAPQISGITTSLDGSNLRVSFDYTDQDPNHPTWIKVRVDGSADYHLYPTITGGIEQGIRFESVDIPLSTTWQELEIDFIEGGIHHLVQHQNPVSNQDQHAPRPTLQIYPNPASSSIYYSLENLERLDEEIPTLKLYNFRGQLIQELSAPARSGSIDLSGLSSGVYFLRWGAVSKRFVH